ncbi:MAG TPA: DUF202 domain-containing protein [Actinopolymorphaceae bacterium]|jgi:uncharacterized membrane protein YidH (DUF202 family)
MSGKRGDAGAGTPPGTGRQVDRGAQLERTALAWNRTLLAMAVNGALLVRIAKDEVTWTAIAGFAVLVLTVPAWAVTSRVYRAVRAGPADVLLGRRRFTVAAAGLVLVIGVLDLLAVVMHR